MLSIINFLFTAFSAGIFIAAGIEGSAFMLAIGSIIAAGSPICLFCE